MAGKENDTPTGAEAFRVAMYCIQQGVPCPEPFATVLARNWFRFQNFECTSLGEAFEIPDHERIGARKNESNTATMFQMVKELQEDGYPLRDSAEKIGALSIVAQFFCVSPSTVDARMTAYRKERKSAGGDADAEWRPIRELTRQLKASLSPVDQRLVREAVGKAAQHIARIPLPKKKPKT